jgi:hypothetical protein
MRHPSFVRRTLGASALSLLFLPTALADDPPAEPPARSEEIESTQELKIAVQQVAEQAVEAAKEAAIEAAEEAQKQGAEAAEAATEQAQKIAEQAQEVAEQAQKAAEGVAKEAEKAAHDAIKRAKRHGLSFNFDQGYQLDLHVTVVPAVLNAQLKLDGKGVLVDSVEKDGPAGKAGIQAFDVLVAVDDKPLAGAKDLYKAVQTSEGKEIAVQLIRGGETQTVKVTPVKHPQLTGDIKLDFNTDVSEEVDIVVGKLEENIREKLKQAGLDVRLQMIRPGHVVPNTFIKTARIPDDLLITIRKQGEEPAEIEAKQGEKTWSIKEGDLEKLPPEVRPHVQRMLGHGPMPFTIALPGKPGMPMIVPGVPVPPAGVAAPHRALVVDEEVIEEHRERRDRARQEIAARKERVPKKEELSRGGVERRLEMMSRELSRMNEQMQALQRELRKSAAAEDEEEIRIEIKERDEEAGEGKPGDDKDE